MMLKLVQIGSNEFDLAPDDPAKKDVDAAVSTLLIAAVHTDGEAPARIIGSAPDKLVSNPYDRRGCWAGKAGNGLWYIRRKPLDGNTRKEAVFMLDRALKKHADALANVTVTDVTPREKSPNSVITEISGSHNGIGFVKRSPLW